MPAILRLKLSLVLAVLVGSWVGGAARASDSPSAPYLIDDIAGDANGLDAGMDLRPASYDPADLRQVRLLTTYREERVGDDGVHYEPTGLAIRFRTTAVPEPSPHALAFRLVFESGTCSSSLDAHVGGSFGGEPFVVWYQFDEACPDGRTGFLGVGPDGGFAFNSSWQGTVDAASSEAGILIPFSELRSSQASVLGPGAVMREPRAAVAVSAGAVAAGDWESWPAYPVLDVTRAGPDFVIGSDVPEDIPCTSGCPQEVSP